jgi:AAA domain
VNTHWKKSIFEQEALGQKVPRIVSFAEFIKDFAAPDYLIRGVLQKRFIYAITADTGKGKTAVCLTIAMCVATGRSLHDRKVAKGRVLYFAGENSDDVRMRCIALAAEMQIGPETLDLYVLDGTFSISGMIDRIREQTEAIGEFALVIVDTSAAYFREEFEDENSNTQAGKHVANLRAMMQAIPGQPTTIVCCHPVKKAAEDNLLPRGGGAALAEYDGNLTCHLINDVVKVHWQGKFRGADFAPFHFQLRETTHNRLRDSDGGLIGTVIAVPITDEKHRQVVQGHGSEADQVLRLLSEDGTMSHAEIARRLGWVSNDVETPTPNKGKVNRIIHRTLKPKKLIQERHTGSGYTVTSAGEKALEEGGNGTRTRK